MTMTSQTEIERKYDLADDAGMPDLSGLDGVGVSAVADPIEYDLVAEYFDTADGALAADRITLRRRRGGADEGWHIKLPAGESRTELHWPLDTGGTDAAAPVPVEVLAPIRGIVRDHPLALVAKLRTRRTVTRLLGPTGDRLAELADDRVLASDALSGMARIWREWEVELLEGAATGETGQIALLDAVEQRVLATGGRPAASASKLARALGRASLDVPRARPRLSRSSAAIAVVGRALEELVGDIRRFDAALRRDDPDAVHGMRTRIRRIRSLFRVYRDVWQRAVTDELDSELRHLGSVLGEARDPEVMVMRATALVKAHDRVDAATLGPLTVHWQATREKAFRRVLAELDRPRYFRLLDALDALLARPALGAAALEPAADVVPAALDRALGRVVRAGTRADAASAEPEGVELLHSTRKAAKRLRYAAEAVSTGAAAVFGAKTRALAASAEAVHDLLGEHRDSLLMQEQLRRAGGGSERAFDLGVLHELERLSGAMCLDDYRAALGRLRKLRR